MRLFLTSLAFGCVALMRAQAAEIRVIHPEALKIPLIIVEGEFVLGDGDRFAEAAEPFQKAIVVFNSPGGQLVVGLQIGQIIRLKKFVTAVPQGLVCASACAIAWLAGTPRTMQPDSRIGFHAAFVEQAGSKVVTGVGNALVGAYLDRLGLPMPAIAYVEQASPDDITWLDPDDARRIGIELVMLPPTDDRPSASPLPRPEARPQFMPQPAIAFPQVPPAPSPQRAATLEGQARSFAEDYFAHWSETNAQALDYFGSVYATRVTFYGAPVNRALLLTEKRAYAQRWPVRVYNARPDSLRIFCNQSNRTCAVSGIVDWDCRSPDRNARSVGSANFSLTVAFSENSEQILAESGSVISRETN